MKSRIIKNNIFIRSAIKKNCKLIIKTLSDEIGIRTLTHKSNMSSTVDFIKKQFTTLGASVKEQTFSINRFKTSNIIAEIKGSKHPERIIVIGAHYDTVEFSTGANDNASGIAGLLEIYRLLASLPDPSFTLRFVAFSMEEPPYFATNKMGSMVYARQCKKNSENIELMISLDMIGYGGKTIKQNYPSEEFSEKYPARGDFLVVAALPSSSRTACLWEKIYNRNSRKKIHAAIAPASLQGINQSDHYSFSKMGYQAIMITDTGYYRCDKYHTMEDNYRVINFSFLSSNIINIANSLYEISSRDILTSPSGG